MKEILSGAVLGVILTLWLTHLHQPSPTQAVIRVDSVLIDSATQDSLRARLRMAISAKNTMVARVRKADWASNALANQLREAQNAADSLPLAVGALHAAQAERDSLGRAIVAQAGQMNEYEALAESRIRSLTEVLKGVRPVLAQRPKPWAVGVLLEGGKPVGGYLSRDLFGRVNLEVGITDKAVLVGLGARF